MIRKKFYPWATNFPKDLSVSFSTLFGLGNLTAPGTWGSVAGILFYALIFSGMEYGGLGFFRYFIIAGFFAYIAIGLCDAAERALKMRDPGKIILDEFVAIPFCFLPILTPSFSVFGIILGFIFFRILDIKKPFNIDKLQSLEGGLGCVADDIAAALVTTAILNICSLILPSICAVSQ